MRFARPLQLSAKAEACQRRMARRGLGGYLLPITDNRGGERGDRSAISIVHLGIDYIRTIEVASSIRNFYSASDPLPIRFRLSKLRDDSEPVYARQVSNSSRARGRVVTITLI